ncbi:MAG: hypothetical protein WA322_21195 [Pseudolabrys sp.]
MKDYRPKESYQRSLTKSETQLITLLRQARDNATDEQWKDFHVSLERYGAESARRLMRPGETQPYESQRGVVALPPKLRT